MNTTKIMELPDAKLLEQDMPIMVLPAASVNENLQRLYGSGLTSGFT